MKLNKKLSFLAVTAFTAVAALTSSCSDDKYWDEDGISGQAITMDCKTMSAAFKPGDQIPSPVFNVVVRRGTTSGTETVTLAGFTADSKGNYTVPVTSADPWSFPTTATFAEGSTFALFNLPTGNAEIQVDDADWPEGSKGYYGHYRIFHPYAYLMDPGETYDEYIAAGWPEAIEFYVFPPQYSAPFYYFEQTDPAGITFKNTTDNTIVLMKNYILPLAVFQGANYTTCSTPIYFNSWTGNDTFHKAVSVLDGWILAPDYDATPGTDEFRGIPNAVGLGCYIFIDDTTRGNDSYVNYKKSNFIFPGGSLGDYSFELAYFGHTFNADKTEEYLDAEVTAIGTDCKDFVVGLVQTKKADDAIAVVQKLYEDRQKAIKDDNDPDAIPRPEGLYGYTETTITEGNTKSFRYMVPQQSADYVFVAFSLNEGAVAETSTVGVKFQSITEMGGEDANWEAMGMGQMTDAMVVALYCPGGLLEDGDIIAYDVPVQKHKTEAGQYRVVTPYADQYYAFAGALNGFTPSDENMVIDASNVDCVKIPPFIAGTLPQGMGTMEIMSATYYYSEAGINDQTLINSGIAGTLKDGVVSFPPAITDAEGTIPSMMYATPESSNDLYISNRQGLFNVVLPDAAQSARKVAAKSAKNFKQLYASKRAQKTMEAIQLISKRSAAAAFGTAKKGAKNKVRNFRVPMALPVR